MNTFLPHADYSMSASALDMRRLGKQRVECKQILLALSDPTYGWQHHPAVLMWRDYEADLCSYAIAVCLEWRDRGYRDSLLRFFCDRLTAGTCGAGRPHWLYREDVHASHRAMLWRKDPSHYPDEWELDAAKYNDYVWPVRSRDLVDRWCGEISESLKDMHESEDDSTEVSRGE